MPATLSRRNFFNLINPSANLAPPSKTKRGFQPLSDPLTPFVPDSNNPWNEYLAGHLLRRTMMAPTWSDIEALVALGDPGKAVDLLLGATSNPSAPGAANDQTEDPNGPDVSNQTLRSSILGKLAGDAGSLRGWWVNLQIQASNSIQEKMGVFWSGHFTTQFDLGNESDVVAPLLYRQNELFRQNGLGNFKDLVKAITLDGAMLIFLGGDQNIAAAPNENYARELMELFTCGLGGGYTEADVQAGARILSGWKSPEFTQEDAQKGIFVPFFFPQNHDVGDKTYLETDFPAIPQGSNSEANAQAEITKMIDTLFAYTANAIATFISTKLYKFFVYSDSDTSDSTEQTVISEMANMFMQDWEIKPVLSALLKSQHFFDNVNIGAQIKTPAEYAIGIARQLGYSSGSVDGAMTTDNEQFFQPPNVSGWPGYHDWLTTNTYPARTSEQAQTLVNGMSAQDLQTFYQQFPAYNVDVTQLATQIGQLLLPRPLSAARLQNFWQALAGGSQESAWINLVNSDPEEAASNLKNLLNTIIALPDFQLC
ncbi:MAG TPA: DUF1800 domain-containing protein [Candidatus Kapabacteria bacterium]